MSQVPNRTKKELLNGSIDFINDTLKLALYDNGVSFSFDPDSHEFVSDILDSGTTAQEPTDSSYSRQDITTPSLGIDSTAEESFFDADDVKFTSLSTTNDIQGIIVYKEITDDTDSPVLFVIDDSDSSDLPVSTDGSDLPIEWAADGIIRKGEV